MTATLLAALAATALVCAVVGPPPRRDIGDRLALLAPPAPRRRRIGRLDDDLLRRLERADLGEAASRPAAAWSALVASAAVLGGLVGGVAVAAVSALLAVVAPPLVLVCVGDRRTRRVERDLPDGLELLSRSLRTGASLPQAVREVAHELPGPLGDDLRRVADRVAAGSGLSGALDEWAARVPTAGVALAVTALALGDETGGARARAIDGLAASLRDREAVAQEVAALSSQAKASVAVIAAAPIVFMVFAVSTDPETGGVLFRTPVGLACLIAGLSLDALGMWWMHRITTGVR